MSVLCVAGHGGEVQLVFGSEDHVLGPDLQDGGGLEGRSDGKQGQLGGHVAAVIQMAVLAMQELQTALEGQGLGRKNKELVGPGFLIQYLFRNQ